MDEPKSNLTKKELGGFIIIDGYLEVEEPCMFKRGLYISVFYWLCYVKEISTDMLEGKVLEERNPYLNEEEGIRMDYSREYHCRGVADDGEYNKKIHALRWDVYTRDKEEFLNIDFWCPLRIRRGGGGYCLDLCKG